MTIVGVTILLDLLFNYSFFVLLAVSIAFQRNNYTFMEGDTNSEEYLVVVIDGQTDIPLLGSFRVIFTNGTAIG